jgi:hypothetical protein
MKGAKEEGTKGFFKGLGQGSLNMVAKPGSGKSRTPPLGSLQRVT